MSDSEEADDTSPGTQSPNLLRRVTGAAASGLREANSGPLPQTPPAKSKETPFYDETDEKRLQEVSSRRKSSRGRGERECRAGRKGQDGTIRE